MDFSRIALFGAMKNRLDYLSERQSVLAQNVANSDTPHYKAMDVTNPDFKTMASSMMNEAMKGNSAAQTGGPLKMTMTSPQHMLPGTAATGKYKIDKRDSTDELNPNGNNVAIEDEMMKVAQNQMDYNKTLNLYHKMISLFETAVGKTGSGA